MVLFIYKKSAQGYLIFLPIKTAAEESPFLNFPHSLWGLVESYTNLTPRGLTVPVACSDNQSEINKHTLDSFLLPKKSE